MIKTFQQLYTEIQTAIIASNSDVTVNPGSVVSDVFINPSAIEDVSQIVIADYVSRSQSLDQILLMLSDNVYLSLVAQAYGISVSDVITDIENNLARLGANFNLTRYPAISSSGIEMYCRNSILTGSDITVYRGSLVSGTNGQKYQVQADTTMYVAQAASYFDPDLLVYALPVQIQALNAGLITNAPATTINGMETPVSGFDFVINKTDISNGEDPETDTAFVNRIKLVYIGNNISTDGGYQKTILDNLPITSVYVAGAGNPYMLRDEGYGGKVDIYIMNTNIVQVQEQVNVASQYYTLLKQPVITGSVTISHQGAATYSFLPNDISIYDGSIMADAKIYWTSWPGTPPSVPYVITYSYNYNVSLAQNLINEDQYRVLAGASPMALVKQAIQIPITINFTFTALSGAVKASVIQNLKTSITAFVDAFTLGVSLHQSDIIKIIETTAGVNELITPFNYFNVSGSVTTVVDTIPAGGNQYLRLGAINIS